MNTIGFIKFYGSLEELDADINSKGEFSFTEYFLDLKEKNVCVEYENKKYIFHFKDYMIVHHNNGTVEIRIFEGKENKSDLKKENNISNDGQLLLKELFFNCLKIERLKSYFIRNIFGDARNSLKLFSLKDRMNLNHYLRKFDWNERRFLLFVFDAMHNVPEFLEELFLLMNGKDYNKYSFKLFEKEMKDLLKLINEKNYRLNAEIHDTHKFSFWIIELNRLIPNIQKALEIISKLKEIGFIEKENIN